MILAAGSLQNQWNQNYQQRDRYLRVGVQLVQRRSEASTAPPHLCVGVEVMVWRCIQCTVAGQNLRTTGRHAVPVPITVVERRRVQL